MRWCFAASPMMAIVAVFGLCLATTGCGESTPTGTVKGKVTIGGAPVTQGRINYYQDGGVGALAQLGSDGSYELKRPEGTGIPVGSYKVFFTPPEPEPISPTNPTPKPPEITGMPTKYLNLSTSDLTADVKEGENSLDFAL